MSVDKKLIPLKEYLESQSKESIIKSILEKSAQSEESLRICKEIFNIKDKKRNKEVVALDIDKISFQEILDDSYLSVGFRKFCAKTLCEENILFWLELNQFKSSFPSLLPNQRLQIVKKITETYILSTAPQELNLNDETRVEIEKLFKLQTGEGITKEFFSNAEKEIYHLMHRDSFPKFIRHPIGKQTFEDYKKVREISSTIIGEYNAPDLNLLSENDWKILFASAVIVEVEEGDILAEDSRASDFVYMLISGTLLMTKRGIRLAKIREEGSVVGEFALLGNFRFSAEIKAKKRSKLYRVDCVNILSIMYSNPILGLKFFKQTGIKLTNILTRFSQTGKKKSLFKHSNFLVSNQDDNTSSNSNSNSIQSLDNEFHLAFPKLRDFGVIIEENGIGHDVSLKKKVVSHKGRLFITKFYICFYSAIFGQKLSEVFPISEFESITKKKDQKIKIFTASSKMSFKFKEEEREAAYQLIISLMQSAEKKPETDRSTRHKVKSLLSLSCDEWDLLLTSPLNQSINGTKHKWTLDFSRGDVIISEGQEYNFIAQILRGSCRVEKSGSNIPLLLSTGEIVGEVTFLNESKASASVYANEDTVSLYVINGAYVKGVLSESNPLVVTKFYRHLCITLTHRIDELLDLL